MTTDADLRGLLSAVRAVEPSAAEVATVLRAGRAPGGRRRGGRRLAGAPVAAALLAPPGGVAAGLRAGGAPGGRRRGGRRLAGALVAAALVVPAGAFAASRLWTGEDVARSLPAGTAMLGGTSPSCTVVHDQIEYDCTLERAPV